MNKHVYFKIFFLFQFLFFVNNGLNVQEVKAKDYLEDKLEEHTKMVKT